MPHTLQDFFATATQKAATDLVTALERIPQDKRHWKPAESARSAMDQMAEVAMLNGGTVQVLETRAWPDFNMEDFFRMKAEMAAQEWEGFQEVYTQNAQSVIAAIQAVPDDALDIQIVLPWQTWTVAQMMAYPHWNMSYHEGQINYIASLLGCLT